MNKEIVRKLVKANSPMNVAGKFLEIVSKSSIITSLYFFFNKSFYFEQKGVLAGHMAFRNSFSSEEGAIYDLVRDVHRIEKGLSMKHLKPTFAEDYISKAVRNLEKLLRDYRDMGACKDDRLCWALDVMSRYFQTVKPTEITERSRAIFERAADRLDYRVGKRYPHARRVVGYTPVSYEDLKKLAIQRRSVRWYKQRKVPRNILDKAIEVAKLSPSACNRQAFEFRIYDDKELISKISDLPGGMTGYKENVPCLVVLTGDYSAYIEDRDRHLIYIDGSLAAMAFQFALETLGLSSCCANWPAVEYKDKKMQNLLNLRDDQRVIMLISVGFPDPRGLVPHSQKKSLDQIRSYNKI